MLELLPAGGTKGILVLFSRRRWRLLLLALVLVEQENKTRTRQDQHVRRSPLVVKRTAKHHKLLHHVLVRTGVLGLFFLRTRPRQIMMLVDGAAVHQESTCKDDSRVERSRTTVVVLLVVSS